MKGCFNLLKSKFLKDPKLKLFIWEKKPWSLSTEMLEFLLVLPLCHDSGKLFKDFDLTSWYSFRCNPISLTGHYQHKIMSVFTNSLQSCFRYILCCKSPPTAFLSYCSLLIAPVRKKGESVKLCTNQSVEKRGGRIRRGVGEEEGRKILYPLKRLSSGHLRCYCNNSE